MTPIRTFFLYATAALAPAALPGQTSLPETPAYGTGDQVLGVSAEYAPFAGEVWGYTTNTQFTSVSLQYAVALTHARRTRLFFAPELVPFATLHERAPSQTNPAAPQYDYGVGARPVAFELLMRRGRRIEPMLRTKNGFLYYNRRVLSPGASQLMFTLDFGLGAHIFTSPRRSIDIGYRYQHQSNANIAVRNPGADSHVIAIGFSQFSRR